MSPAGRHRTLRRALACSFGAACAAVVFAGPAAAHGGLQDADPRPGTSLPASPDRIEVVLTEPAASVSRLTLVDEGGRAIRLGPTRVEHRSLRASVETLEAGSYSVRWAAVSEADGHLTSGQFRFSVQEREPGEVREGESPGSLIASAGPRLLVVGGALLWAGAVLLAAFVVTPCASEGLALTLFARRLGRIGAVATVTLVAGEALTLVSASARGLPVFTTEFFFGSSAGGLTLARIGLGVVGLALWFVLRPTRWERYQLPLPLLYLGVLAVSGHAVDSPSGPLSAVLLDVVHLVAAAAWLGGITLLGLLPSSPRGAPDTPAVAGTARRFSPIALTSAAALGITGIFATDQQTHGLSDLAATLYGNVLIVKLSFVAVLLAMSAQVGLRLLPALLAAAPDAERAARLASRLRRGLRAEAPVAAGIIVCVALMTSLASPRVLATEVASEGGSFPVRPVFARAQADGVHDVALSVFPGARGPNTVVASVEGRKAAPREIELVLDAPGEGEGIGVRVRGRAGVYVADVGLPTAGRWRATVAVGESKARFEVPLGAGPERADGVRVVTVADLTGAAHARCRDEVIGQMVALEEAGRPITQVVVDSPSREVGKSASVLLGGCGVNPHRLERVAEQLEVPLVAGGGAGGGRWSWPLDPDPLTEGGVLARLGGEALGARTAVVALEDARRYRRAANAFTRRFADEGGATRKTLDLADPGTPREIASLAPDLLVLLGSPETAAPVVAALERRHWLPERGVLAGSGLLGGELGQAAPGWVERGVISVAGYYLQDVNLFAPYARQLLGAFPGERPSTRGFGGYLRARLLLGALRGLEKAPDSDAIARALDSRFQRGWREASIDIAWSPGARSGARRLALYRVIPAIDFLQLLGGAHAGHGSSGGGLSLYSGFYGKKGPPTLALAPGG